MNSLILEQYRQFRQTGSFNLLYQLADHLDALTSLERRSGEIPYSRHGMITRRVESRLNDPEQALATHIYRQFFESKIQSECYEIGIADDLLFSYCEIRSRLYWAGRLTPEEWGLVNQIESTSLSGNPEFERSISQALENCFAELKNWEVA